jgi:hypothetical protein
MTNILEFFQKKTSIHNLYFLTIFVIGWLIVSDYGVTLDDEIYYINGFNTYEYVKHFLLNIFSKNQFDLSIYKVKMFEWPVLFELFLVALCNALNISEMNEIYLLAHKINFILFFIALILFFKLINKRFKNTSLALLSTLFFLLSPRIFSESFYNSRDIFFLSLFVYFIFFAYKFINYKSIKNIIILSLFSAILINSKILGIIPVGLFILLYIFFELDNYSKIKNEKNMLILFVFFIIFFSYLLWPYLWDDPLRNIKSAFFNIIKVHENFNIINYYFGDYVSSKIVAWHYRPVWLIITTPVIIIILFLIGIFLSCIKLFRYLNNNLKIDYSITKDTFLDIFLFLVFFITFFITIKFNQSKFGGWRHLYFLYVAIVYFAIIATNQIFLSFNKDRYKKIFGILIFANLLYVLIWNLNNHPNQYIYFNFLFKNYAVKNFDLDIWGISHKQSLDKILVIDSSKDITVFGKGYTSLRNSYLFLNREERKRIKFSDFENSKYIIDNKMKRVREYNVINNDNFDKLFEITIDRVPISTTYINKKIK